MKESTLMQYVSYHLHTYVKKYTKENILVTSVCMRSSFWDPSETDTALQKELLDIGDDFPIQLTAVHEDFLYATLNLSDALLLIGPIRLDSPLNLKRQLDTTAIDFSNAHWQDTVYTFPYWKFCREILFVYHLFADRLLTEGELLSHNCVDKEFEHLVHKNLSSILFSRQEESETHNSYQQELREQSSIENGDLETLERSLEEDYAGTFGTLSKNKLRQYKNLGIVVITLASRSAIRGGLNPEISFSLSDTFIQKIEEMNDVGAIIHIIRDAEREYTQMVHEIRRRQTGVRHAYDNPHVEQCKKYIFSHLHDRITVQGLAEELGLHANYLSELFKSHECITLSEYIMREKITRAKNLLIYSQYSYIEIATYLGFSSQSHLGKQFKKYTGHTLKHFRDKYEWKETESP